MLSLVLALKNLKKYLNKFMGDYELKVFLSFFIILVSVAVVSAVTYNSMLMKSSIGIKS